jgi:hypothetical protein
VVSSILNDLNILDGALRQISESLEPMALSRLIRQITANQRLALSLLRFYAIQFSLLPVNLSLLRLDLLLHSRILVLALLHLIAYHGASK